ncbi:MAG: hypothetical protein V4510_11010 [bacterium]
MRHAPARLPSILLVLFLAGLLLPPAEGTPGANPRAPLATVGAVMHVAVAETGTMLAVTDDPGTRLPTPGNAGADVPTWYLWDRAGTIVHSGSGDLTSCANRLGDLCQSPSAAGALSADGLWFAVGSNVAMSPTDATRGLLQAGHVGASSTVTHVFSNPIAQIAMDRNGKTIAVLERIPAIPNSGQPDKAQVNLLSFDGSVFADIFTPYQIVAPAQGLALARDGQKLAVAADNLYIFSRTAGAPGIVSAVTGPVQSVAVAPGGAHSILAGYASGKLAILDDGSALQVLKTLDLGTSPVTAVTTDGVRGLAGDSTGKLFVLSVSTATPQVVVDSSRTGAPDAIRQLFLSRSGGIGFLRSATEVHLMLANGTELWSHKPATAPVGGGLDDTGDVAATGVGAGVVAFDASHAIAADPVATIQVPPRVARDIDVTYRNAGNRPEQADVGASFPANWFMTVTPTSMALAVGQTAVLHVHFVVGDSQPPGLTELKLEHTLASGGSGTTVIPVEVVPKDAVAMSPDGPATLALKRGETAHFGVKIENRGNTDAHVDVVGAVTPAGWTMDASPRHFDLNPGKNGTFSVSLTASATAADGETGVVRLTLAGRPGSELDLSGVVGARFAPDLRGLARVDAAAGSQITVNLTLVNAGNVADRFTVQPVGVLPDGWGLRLDASPLLTPLLEPGEAAPLAVHITVPAGSSGQRAQLRVHADSLGDATKSDEQSILVMVARGQDATTQGSPLPLEVPIMALAAMALLLRRRQGRPRP